MRLEGVPTLPARVISLGRGTILVVVYPRPRTRVRGEWLGLSSRQDLDRLSHSGRKSANQSTRYAFNSKMCVVLARVGG
jgi:hypothetical protein